MPLPCAPEAQCAPARDRALPRPEAAASLDAPYGTFCELPPARKATFARLAKWRGGRSA